MMDASARTQWATVLTDSLEKVFVDEKPRSMDTSIPLTAFLGEVVSFQIAFIPPSVTNFLDLEPVQVSADAATAPYVTLRAVDLVPCTLLAFDGHDDGYLRDTAGLYPDLLRPLSAGTVAPFLGQWRSIWVDVMVPESASLGANAVLPVTVNLVGARTGGEISSYTVEISIIDAILPELSIVNTHWFHCDGIADYYGYEVFDELHWAAIDRFLGKAVEMGVNSVLTPCWTPPLDTVVGGLRTPVQLLDIELAGEDSYSFNFARLHRWMELCRKRGITHLEIAHLFTQWGAEATPAIYISVDGALERRFGWDVPATSPNYRLFLEQLIPALRAELEREWGLDKVLFHISDEPAEDMHASYRAAVDVVRDLLVGCVVVDAVSDFDYWASGTIETPVVATNAAAPFLEAGVKPLWLYYCLGQHELVSNRFISMPSSRNRVIGTQLFLAGAAGFLHWGFNFYNAQGSTHLIDPFTDTCAGGAFPAGDPFIVYPGPDGTPWESIRFRVFAEAMNDHRAFQLLRELGGEELVRQIVDPAASVTLENYTLEVDHYRRVRSEVNAQIRLLLAL